MKTVSILISYCSGFLLLVTSCVTMENIQEHRVDNKNIEYVSNDNGSPTIVFETGMGPDISTWLPIYDSVANISSTFAYNRPGYGNSSLHNPPHSVREVAEQLHNNLRSLGQEPPYLLIGHSAGGLYVNMFARLFPDEVVGVIFLDASHPSQFEYFKDHQQLLYSILVASCKNGDRKYELTIVESCESDFENIPPFPPIPISVLTAGKKSSPLESDKLRKQWLEFQSELAVLSPNSEHIIVEGSGHYIHKDRPAIVLEEIRRILSSGDSIKQGNTNINYEF